MFNSAHFPTSSRGPFWQKQKKTTLEDTGLVKKKNPPVCSTPNIIRLGFWIGVLTLCTWVLEAKHIASTSCRKLVRGRCQTTMGPGWTSKSTLGLLGLPKAWPPKTRCFVFSRLGPQVVPLYPFWGEGSPTNTDCRKKKVPLFWT